MPLATVLFSLAARAAKNARGSPSAISRAHLGSLVPALGPPRADRWALGRPLLTGWAAWRPAVGTRGAASAAAGIDSLGADHFSVYGGYMGTGNPSDGKAGADSSVRRILVTVSRLLARVNRRETLAYPRAMRTRRYVKGAAGQIGAEFVPYLRALFGQENVIASDIKSPRRHSGRAATSHASHAPHHRGTNACNGWVYCDVLDADTLTRVVLEQDIDTVVHLASLLSAIGEKNPLLALKVNTTGIQNVLEVARLHELTVLAPSTIAVFGATTPKDDTPDVTVCEPSTVYGVTKVHLELLGSYYSQKFGVDFRSLRYPGVISSQSPPGGGTTDYAVDIYHAALRDGRYRCFLEASTRLPMMYMRDCLRATTELLSAPRDSLTRCVYNVSAMSFTPEELSTALAARLTGFEVEYAPDFRQGIARSWPRTIDDSRARQDWGWAPEFDIESMTDDMLITLAAAHPEYAQSRKIMHLFEHFREEGCG